MRISSYIMLIDKDKILRKIFTSIGMWKKYNVLDSLQTIELFTDSNEYKLFIEELLKENIAYEERFKRVYSETELLLSEYLYVTSSDYWGYPQPENGYIERCYNKDSVCPICNNGPIQKAPFLVKGAFPKSKKRELLNLNWVYEFIINDRIKKICQREKLTGCDYLPILDYKKNAIIPGWSQLLFVNHLPEMSEKTIFPIVQDSSGVEKQNELGIRNPSLCLCGKMGKNLPEEIFYDSGHIKEFMDFNKTFEWLGGGYTTYQHKIISNKVFMILKNEGIKYLEFRPIYFL